MPNKRYIDETANWVERVVIKHNFCPFAHKPVRHKLIRYQVCTGSEDEITGTLIDELILLRDTDQKCIETSILITPNTLISFDDYNQYLNVVDVLIKQFNLQGIIQIAGFHPDYQFADLDINDVRNYTNRSPYPMFHLILEDSIEKARASYSNVENIPDNNMSLLLELGLDTAKQQLKDCYSGPDKPTK